MYSKGVRTPIVSIKYPFIKLKPILESRTPIIIIGTYLIIPPPTINIIDVIIANEKEAT